MAHVVEYQEFVELIKEVREIKAENAFLRSVILGQRWLSKPQTLKVLDVSETTLWRLTKEDKIVNCKDGSKTVYDIDSVRIYLATKNIEKVVADDRVIKACYEYKRR